MDAIADFALFRAVVETGGVSAAARLLESSPPAVSRRLAALEQRLGVRLAERQSRRFRLTDEGALLYERCCTILDQVRDAEAEVATRGGAARGLLRVGAPTEYGRRYVAPLVAAFASHHPGLAAHLILSDAGLEVGVDDCDVILRIGPPDDPSLIVRKIAATPRVVCASPTYLAKRGPLASPNDLATHSCLCLARRHRLVDLWRYVDDGVEREVKVKGALSSGSGEVLHAWALAGEGISLEAAWDVADDIAAGRLIALLPRYDWGTAELHVAFAPGKPVPPRVRLFVDHLVRAMAL
jgi:DNA-binding transcriptional LysR family regulator